MPQSMMNRVPEWVVFTGATPDEQYTGHIVARVNGVGVRYDVGLDDETGDCLLFALPDGPAETPVMFGGRLTGPDAYTRMLEGVLMLVKRDIKIAKR